MGLLKTNNCRFYMAISCRVYCRVGLVVLLKLQSVIYVSVRVTGMVLKIWEGSTLFFFTSASISLDTRSSLAYNLSQ